MNIQILTRILVCAVIATSVSVNVKPVQADIVTILFTGLNPDSPSGMDFLNTDLENRFAADFPTETYTGMVYGYDEGNDAFNDILAFDEIDKLFLVGHSWGGNALIRLAQEQLLPEGIQVDATFQIDSIDIFDSGLDDDVLPTNVVNGYNYYQIATFPDFLQGEQNVLGAENVNVEELFNDTSITHTSIDNDQRVYDLVYSKMEIATVPEPNSLALLGLGIVSVIAFRRRNR